MPRLQSFLLGASGHCCQFFLTSPRRAFAAWKGGTLHVGGCCPPHLSVLLFCEEELMHLHLNLALCLSPPRQILSLLSATRIHRARALWLNLKTRLGRLINSIHFGPVCWASRMPVLFLKSWDHGGLFWKGRLGEGIGREGPGKGSEAVTLDVFQYIRARPGSCFALETLSPPPRNNLTGDISII